MLKLEALSYINLFPGGQLYSYIVTTILNQCNLSMFWLSTSSNGMFRKNIVNLDLWYVPLAKTFLFYFAYF